MRTLLIIIELCVSCLILLCSCHSDKKHIASLVEMWEGKEIIFPINPTFTIYARDTIDHSIGRSNFKIVTYWGMTKCISCKFKLEEWKGLIKEFKSKGCSVDFLFFVCPRNLKDISYFLKWGDFRYPVCIDYDDSFYKTNNLINDDRFHTFLLDRNNDVIIVGSPVYNDSIRSLYAKIISKDGSIDLNKMNIAQTIGRFDTTSVSFGYFDRTMEQETNFILTNVGNNLLAINKVLTSCGCISIEYSKNRIPPGKSIRLQVRYKASQMGYFAKDITVFCNTDKSPYRLKISGNSK